MNAMISNSEVVTPRLAGRSKFHEFGVLLKRELWEHKGGILWTPLILAGLQVIVTAIALIAGWYRMSTQGFGRVVLNGGTEISINGNNLQQFLAELKPSDLTAGGNAIDMFYYASSTWPLIVAGFVTFFYCLGTLYDERKDRSILFWKSMPVSDLQTVLSKAVTALVVIPLVAMLVSAGLVLLYAFVGWAFLSFQGGATGAAIFANSNPLKVIGSLLSALPIHVVWALPAVGWLMLCSAFVKRVPFLWALGVPLVAGIMLLWFEAGMSWGQATSLSEAYYQHVVYRILPSVMPGSFVTQLPNIDIDFERNLMPYSGAVIQAIYSVLLRAETWIGAVAGAVMLWGAAQIRRRNGAI